METIRKQFLSIRRIDSDTLKLMAVITMLIDHIAAALIRPALGLMEGSDYDRWSDIYHMLRNIGRIAFPIFVFLLIEGFFHTRSRKKYFGRLVLFALLSEIPYDMAFYGVLFYINRQNVFWTLSFGFLIIWGLEKLYEVYRTSSGIVKANEKQRSHQIDRALKDHPVGLQNRNHPMLADHAENRIEIGYPIGFVVSAIGIALAGAAIVDFLQADYSIYGFLLILLFYLGEHGGVPRILTCIGGYLLFLWEPYCLGGFLLILLYNGTRMQRGRGFQYFFYLFYPIHLLILGLIRVAFLSG